MLKRQGTVGRSGALFVATFMVLATAAFCTAGLTSAAPVRHQSLVAPHHQNLWVWLKRHGVLTPRSGAGRRHATHTGRHTAHVAIVGGSQISIEQAPWQVFVVAALGEGEGFLLCGGSILDATHIVTAAHCFFNPNTERRLLATNILVVAGISNFEAEHEEQAQVQLVESLRVHPYYEHSIGAGAPDDVATLTLSEGLVLSSASGSAVNSIGLGGAGAIQPEGAQLNLTGFGLEDINVEFPDGTLNSIGETLGSSRKCGGEADAVWLCGSASMGSACFGDSGSGLTTTGSTVTLAGVMDTVYGTSQEFCRANSDNGFVNLVAPEIRDFVEGDSSPPRAPRGGNAIVISGVPKVGYALTCSPGDWSGEPTIVYSFTDSSSGQVLQSGESPTYELSASDVGRTIRCEVQAANAGGTGTVRTTSLRPIEAAPPPTLHLPTEAPPPTLHPPSEVQASPSGGSSPVLGGGASTGSGGVEAAKVQNEGVLLSATSLTVQSGGLALAQLNCKEAEGCNGTLTLKAKKTVRSKGHRKTTRAVKIGTASFSLEAGETGTGKIQLNATGRALLSASHGKLAATLAIEETEVHTWTEGVHLVAQAPRAKGSHKRKR